MIAATLFSGIGAPETAMPHWDWRWCAEIERFACAVLQARHPHTVNLGDVTTDGFTERAAAIARPDVLVFGSPCQSFSVAGQRLGLDDPRGNLALVALGIVDRLKPRWFVFENVPGLLSSDQGRDFGIFLRTVDELGYRCAWSVLDAQHFGVAQRRERVFVVGHLGDWRYPAAVLLEPEGVRGHHPPRRQKGQRPAPTISARTSAGGGLSTDFDLDGGLIAPTHVVESETFVVADPISANEGKTYSHGGNNAGHLHNVVQAYDVTGTGPNVKSGGRATDLHTALRSRTPGHSEGSTTTLVAHALTAEGADASEDGTGRGPPLVVTPILEAVAFMENGRGEVRVSEHTDSLKGAGGKPGQGYQAVAFQSNAGRDFTADDDRSPPLRSEGIGGVGGVAIAFSCKDSGVPDIAWALQERDAKGADSDTKQGHLIVAQAVALRGREGGATAEVSEIPSALRASQGGGDKAHVLTNGGADACTQETNAREILRALREQVGAEAFAEWGLGLLNSLQSPEILQSFLHGKRIRCATSEGKSWLDDSALPRAESLPTGALQQLWEHGPDGCSPQGRELAQQLAQQFGATLPVLSHQATSAVRRLTPREAERLQGFPDDFTLVPYRGKPASDGPRYRALGNSMAVPVVRWILERIEAVDDGESLSEAAE